jgi:molybdopterin-guanine dinucleotide biosynthesis protein A
MHGVVLAGGQSRRMGMDKARLSLEGQSLLARSVALLEACGCATVSVSGEPALYPEWFCVADAYPHLGPVSGIVSVLNAMPQLPDGSAVLVIPVDVPWLTSGILHHLLSMAAEHDACMIADNPLPLVLIKTTVLSARCTEAEAALSCRQAWSVRRFIEPLAVQVCAQNEAMSRALFNVNTPAAWKEIQAEITPGI